MTMTDKGVKALGEFAGWLEEKHAHIMDIEKAGLELLENNDVSGYREKMRQKAEELVALKRESLPLLADLPEDRRIEIEHSINGFSASAATALRLGSVFYMSALLYPDDHKKGEPDNLRLFIESIK